MATCTPRRCRCAAAEREDKAVYWLVIDWYEKAKEAAPSDDLVVREANAKISLYQPYFPDPDALFFKGWEVGKRYSIDYGCYSWTGETTTVKAL